MRYDRSEYGIHRHLIASPERAPTRHVRTPSPVYAYGARVRYWAALWLSCLALVASITPHV